MKINKLILGPLQTNCYILEKDSDVLIIDPADDFNTIKDFIGNKNVVEILVTHHHFDHINALKECENYYNLKHNTFHISSFNYEVINTPGHTDDSISFYFKNDSIIFCGDFIFNGSIGRFDFENSNKKDMIESLNKISTYPDETILFPGHGNKTVLKNEKEGFSYYINMLY